MLMVRDPRQDGACHPRFHHVTRNSTQFKTYELFISGIFRLLLTETTESKTTDWGGWGTTVKETGKKTDIG